MSIIIPANSAVGGGYDVANSARFNSGSSDSLTRTFATPTNAKKFTISQWVKRTKINESQILLNQGADYYYFVHNNEIDFETSNGRLKTNRLFRDTNAWYHIVIVVDTTLGTADDRIKMFVNGVQETSFGSRTNPSQNSNFANFNSANEHSIAKRQSASDMFLNGYLAEQVFLDGTAAAITDLGEFDEDSGIWKPIDVSGLTFGNNGFYLDFENSGNLGADASGESHNWTANNLTAIDQSTDSCTNNSATWNPLFPSSGTTAFSEGNLKLVSSGTNGGSMSSFGVSSGKWYIEVKQTAVNEPLGNGESLIAVAGDPTGNLGNLSGVAPTGSAYYGIRNYNGTKFANDPSENSSTSWHGNWTAGDIISIALDMDNNNVYFAKNGQYANGSGSWNQAFTGSPAAIALSTGKTFYFISAGHSHGSATETFELNCFSPSFAISSGNADADGYGNFEYAVPSGYFSLNTKNLAEYG